MLKSSSDNRTMKETGFTGPRVFLSVNVRGPVYFAVCAGLTVSCFPSSAHTYRPRLFHGPDCFTVSTRCTYSDLGSRGYFSVYRHSCSTYMYCLERKFLYLCFKFDRIIFLRVPLIIKQHWFRYWLITKKLTSH